MAVKGDQTTTVAHLCRDASEASAAGSAAGRQDANPPRRASAAGAERPQAPAGGILLLAQQPQLLGQEIAQQPHAHRPTYTPTMAGHGEARPFCGAIRQAEACETAAPTRQATLGEAAGVHTSRILRWSCHRLACPEQGCRDEATARAGIRAEERLEAVRTLRGLPTLRHFWLSPPPVGPESWAHRFASCADEGEWLDVEARFRRKALQLVKRLGLTGGAWVFHPWRCEQSHGGKARYHNGSAYLSPHLHFLAWGYAKRPRDFMRESKGWLYGNLDAGVEDRSIAGTLGYLLDHVAVIERHLSYNYFGLAGVNQVVIEKVWKESRVVECEAPKCGRACYVYMADPVSGEIRWDEPNGVATRTIERRSFKLRRPGPALPEPPPQAAPQRCSCDGGPQPLEGCCSRAWD